MIIVPESRYFAEKVKADLAPILSVHIRTKAAHDRFQSSGFLTSLYQVRGSDTLLMYRADQWTCFAFGIIETILVIVFFRGVGVVGHRAPKPVSVSETEKAESLDSIPRENQGYRKDVNDQESEPGKKAIEFEATPAEGTVITVRLIF